MEHSTEHLKVNSEFPLQRHRGPDIRLTDRPDFTGNLPAECEVGKKLLCEYKRQAQPNII